jgi:hypothetical protein
MVDKYEIVVALIARGLSVDAANTAYEALFGEDGGLFPAKLAEADVLEIEGLGILKRNPGTLTLPGFGKLILDSKSRKGTGSFGPTADRDDQAGPEEEPPIKLPPVKFPGGESGPHGGGFEP